MIFKQYHLYMHNNNTHTVNQLITWNYFEEKNKILYEIMEMVYAKTI